MFIPKKAARESKILRTYDNEHQRIMLNKVLHEYFQLRIPDYISVYMPLKVI